jgi:uncharacterized membrane protein YfcA
MDRRTATPQLWNTLLATPVLHGQGRPERSFPPFPGFLAGIFNIKGGFLMVYLFSRVVISDDWSLHFDDKPAPE